MSQHESTRQSVEIDDNELFAPRLSDEETMRASELHEYIYAWVMEQGNTSTHIRAMFMYLIGRGNTEGAYALLMKQFGDMNSQIPASEPAIWTEWISYCRWGFTPGKPL